MENKLIGLRLLEELRSRQGLIGMFAKEIYPGFLSVLVIRSVEAKLPRIFCRYLNIYFREKV
jgi:hypothetical protein